MGYEIVFGNNWDLLLKEEFEKEYFLKLMKFIHSEYKNQGIYPKYEDLFQVFKLTCFNDVKVVVIGQDPYHRPGEAHGLCFSVSKGIKIPKSLHNIFLELVDDVGIDYPGHGNLESWAKQGVFLLNSILTVKDNMPLSHKNIGWEQFTDNVITLFNNKTTPVVYLLWGNFAKSKIHLINNKNHKILTATHPSPLSAFGGFFSCKHFSQTNEFLISNGMTPINWQI